MEVVGKDIQSFQETVRDHSEYDFTQYSHTSLRRRLTRILLEYEVDMEELTRRMRNDGEFLESIVKKLTVHTTELFRDPDIWKKIKKALLPSLNDKSVIRIWHPGCSTGQEIYSMMMVIRIWHPGCSTGQEIYSMMMVLDELGMLQKTEIYGSDINPDVLEVAREGAYKYHFNQSYLENFDRVILNGSGISSPGNRKHWKKYFHIDETHDLIRMKDYLRLKPVYKKLDLVKDPNLFLVKFDLIVCRNVIIYFNNELQNRVFDLFYSNLNEHGTLILGVHESILGPFSKRFIKKDPFYHKPPI
jgi:chemotaxis protein methyltransferase CheR